MTLWAPPSPLDSRIKLLSKGCSLSSTDDLSSLRESQEPVSTLLLVFIQRNFVVPLKVKTLNDARLPLSLNQRVKKEFIHKWKERQEDLSFANMTRASESVTTHLKNNISLFIHDFCHKILFSLHSSLFSSCFEELFLFSISEHVTSRRALSNLPDVFYQDFLWSRPTSCSMMIMKESCLMSEQTACLSGKVSSEVSRVALGLSLNTSFSVLHVFILCTSSVTWKSL